MNYVITTAIATDYGVQCGQMMPSRIWGLYMGVFWSFSSSKCPSLFPVSYAWYFYYSRYILSLFACNLSAIILFFLMLASK